MVGTLAAARTKRLRIGTAVSLAPFYHPLRLAEEVALLDLLSGGRVNWGAGRGFARVEFTAFGVPPEESVSRFHETVEIVLKAWTEAKLTFASKHFHFEDVEVLPKPVQQPHPPVWVAGRTRASITGPKTPINRKIVDGEAVIGAQNLAKRNISEAIDKARLRATASATAFVSPVSAQNTDYAHVRKPM
jgi:hypothetical protein